MQFIPQFILVIKALLFMEVLELLLAKFVFIDNKNDEAEMKYEAKIDSFDFIIGK